jgi:hypothetical protein
MMKERLITETDNATADKKDSYDGESIEDDSDDAVVISTMKRPFTDDELDNGMEGKKKIV